MGFGRDLRPLINEPEESDQIQKLNDRIKNLEDKLNQILNKLNE